MSKIQPFTSIKLIHVSNEKEFFMYVINKESRFCGKHSICVFQGNYFSSPRVVGNDPQCAVDWEFYQIYPGHEAHWLRYKQHTHNHERLKMNNFHQPDILFKY